MRLLFPKPTYLPSRGKVLLGWGGRAGKEGGGEDGSWEEEGREPDTGGDYVIIAHYT